ncbi:MAG TPA: NrfD/PsrC family molybdoenzyme membrane anchor subunit [bacterium]|jgi:molybdopterin-containing oxidoreductase family membrane subunit
MSHPAHALPTPAEIEKVLPTENILSDDLRLAQVTDDIVSPLERFPNWLWWVAFLISATMALAGAGTLTWLLMSGQGIFGLQIPVGWAFDITNFVFWIGIGHAGTLISAILFLLRQKWRTAINRSAEAMTIFAVMTAGIFPAFHVGRQWLDFWLFPYPNHRMLWINFRSPLVWDVFAVSTYFTISLLFWYTGLIPDFATIRDRAKSALRKRIFNVLSFGWTGSVRDWAHYEKAYLLFAGMATALVLSVHTVVSYDFATSVVPGWHTTIFPPYFVAGAIFSGFAMVLTLLVIMRKAFKLEHLITMRHLELMCKIITVTGLMVGFSYMTEWFNAWYSVNPFERFVFLNRAFGHYWWAFWIMFTCNAIIPQIFFFKKARMSLGIMFVVSLLVNLGMWFERFNIIVTSLYNDYLPSIWHVFKPTIFDIGWTVGAFGLFFTLFLLFVRIAPVISMAEMKATLPNPTGRKQKFTEHGEPLRHG